MGQLLLYIQGNIPQRKDTKIVTVHNIQELAVYSKLQAAQLHKRQAIIFEDALQS